MTPQQVADIATAAIAYRIAEKAFWASFSIEEEERIVIRDACLAAKHTLYAALDAVLDEVTQESQVEKACVDEDLILEKFIEEYGPPGMNNGSTGRT